MVPTKTFGFSCAQQQFFFITVQQLCGPQAVFLLKSFSKIFLKCTWLLTENGLLLSWRVKEFWMGGIDSDL